MKYEYQDAIIKELLNIKGNDIDKSTLKTATIGVFHYEFGQYKANPMYATQKINSQIHIHIINGSVFGVLNKKGAEYSIDFTIYVFDYPVGQDNKILCNLEII